MGAWKWLGSGLKIATGWIPGVGTAVEEGLDHWSEHRERRSALASLLDVREQGWRPDGSPAALLRADFGVVPFHGREAELQDLASWCDGEAHLALRLYTAPGGFGKTRLLRQVVRLRREAGWDAGFLAEGALGQNGAAALFEERQGPLLLVLDYAESRRGEIEPVVASARGSSRERVRIVLLARAEGDWWSELRRAGDGVGDFLQGSAVEGPIGLLPLTDSLEAREASYRKAVRAFADALDKPGEEPETARAPRLDDDDFERVLLVHAAALAAVEGEEVPSGGLLDWLLSREERGIDRVRERQAGLGLEFRPALRHAAALVTLAQGADSRAETVEIVRRAPGLADQPRARLDRIAEALHVLYRGRRWCDGVEPDLVGEHLVGRQLRDAPELVDAAFGEGVPELRLEAGLTVLNRLAQRRPADRILLADAVGSGLDRLALPAVRAAVAGGDPVGLVLAEALARSRDLEVARQLVGHLPYPTTALREAAAAVEDMLWSALVRREGEELNDDEREDLAGRANDRSVRLSDLGRSEEALEAIEQAVEIYRDLARSRPDAIRPDLAGSLNNLSGRLADLGRREEALEAIEQAVEIYRDLARSRPDAIRPHLAMGLHNLSTSLGNLGRREEALEAIEQAVEIFRDLARSRPDVFRPNFAESLNNLSNRLAELGRRKEALETIEQAIEIFRDLARSRPDAFRPGLALSLNSRSNRLAGLGRREEALEAIEQAVAIYRELARSRPGVFRPGLALSINNLSNRLGELGQREEALEAIEQAVEIFRDLARSRPDVFRPDLARSLMVLHDRLKEAGRLRPALEAAEEAIGLLEPHFRCVPRAFAGLMGVIVPDYEETAAACGVQPNEERLRSIREILASVSGEA
jgi:tetratricopeptide (TPR) repeat protein